MMVCGRILAYCYDEDCVTMNVLFVDGPVVTFNVEPTNHKINSHCVVSYRPGSGCLYLEKPSRLLRLRIIGDPVVRDWKI